MGKEATRRTKDSEAAQSNKRTSLKKFFQQRWG